MAERLKKKIVEREKMVDVVCGPDAYRDLPHLLASSVSSGHAAGTVGNDCQLVESICYPLVFIKYPYVNHAYCQRDAATGKKKGGRGGGQSEKDQKKDKKKRLNGITDGCFTPSQPVRLY